MCIWNQCRRQALHTFWKHGNMAQLFRQRGAWRTSWMKVLWVLTKNTAVLKKKEGGGWKWWFFSSLQKYRIEMQYIFLSEQDCFCNKKMLFHQKPGAKGPKYKCGFICKREDNSLDRTANITACRGECNVTAPSMCVVPFSCLVSWPEWLCSSIPSLEPSPTESTNVQY